jgi:hypothetical protein
MAEKGLSFWQAPSTTAIGKFNNLTEREGKSRMKTQRNIEPRTKFTARDTLAAEQLHPGGVDWLTYTIAVIGGVGKDDVREDHVLHLAARELGWTWQKVVAILEHGVGSLTFSQVADLADRARVSMSLLRVGPPSAGQRKVAKEIARSHGRKRAG